MKIHFWIVWWQSWFCPPIHSSVFHICSADRRTSGSKVQERVYPGKGRKMINLAFPFLSPPSSDPWEFCWCILPSDTLVTHLFLSPFLLFVFYFLNFIELQLIYSVALVSGVHYGDSITHTHTHTHTHTFILFQILFLFRLLQNIEQSPSCCKVGPCWLTILLMYI